MEFENITWQLKKAKFLSKGLFFNIFIDKDKRFRDY